MVAPERIPRNTNPIIISYKVVYHKEAHMWRPLCVGTSFPKKRLAVFDY